MGTIRIPLNFQFLRSAGGLYSRENPWKPARYGLRVGGRRTPGLDKTWGNGKSEVRNFLKAHARHGEETEFSPTEMKRSDG